MYEEYKDYALDLVSRNFDISKDDLLNKTKKAEDVVDARCAPVHSLAFQGVCPCTIEKWTGISVASQSYLHQRFEIKKQSSPWFFHQMIKLIRDAKTSCPISFRAHDKDGNIVMHQGAFE